MLELKHTIRVLPIHVINPQSNKERAIHFGEELESLIQTLGGQIVDRVMQRLDNPDNVTFIGKGKIEEVLEKVQKEKVDVVVLNTMAKARQIHALKSALQKANPQIEVWDRVDLILHIFDKHATTLEAKLQIELARMKYMGPRIYGMGFVMSRQGGGIGTRGIGETNTERMRRHWRSEIKKVKDQLEKISQDRENQLERRKKAGFKTISIVGYTNAGKSSLFNLLSGKNMLVEDELFATLDSVVGKINISELKDKALLTDTIGFIRNLPPHLIDAFKSTLIESIHADVLLHVIDVSDPEVDEKISVVKNILLELGCNMDNVIYVFNKIDAVEHIYKKDFLERYGKYTPVFISVRTEEGIPSITETITSRFTNNIVT